MYPPNYPYSVNFIHHDLPFYPFNSHLSVLLFSPI